MRSDFSLNTDNNTNYYDTPKYVVDVLGGVVSKTYRHLTKSRNHRNVITASSRALSCHHGGSLNFLFRGSITVGRQQ